MRRTMRTLHIGEMEGMQLSFHLTSLTLHGKNNSTVNSKVYFGRTLWIERNIPWFYSEFIEIPTVGYFKTTNAPLPKLSYTTVGWDDR